MQKRQIGRRRGVYYTPRILITGDSGFFAKNLIPYMESYYPSVDLILPQGKTFFDLTRAPHVRQMFDSIHLNRGAVNAVIGLAAYSGGMFENMSRQASFWYQNTAIIMNLLEECATHKIGRILLPIGGCSYPDTDESNNGVYKEDDIWGGFPNRNSFGYSMAKKQAIVGAMAYKQQFNIDTTIVIPTNPIGPWDNVNPDASHVVMALIGRFLEAIAEGYNNVTIYGSGKVLRDFLSIYDIVKYFPLILDKYSGVGPLNISSGKGTSVAELAEIICRLTGFTGKLIYDTTKPDGQKVKILDNSKLVDFLKGEGITWQPIPLEEALGRTIEWYKRRVQDVE